MEIHTRRCRSVATPAIDTDSLGVPIRQRREVGDELGRLGHGEVESEHADVDRDSFDTVGSRDEQASVGVDGFDNTDRGVDPIEHLRWGCVHRDPDVHVPASEGGGSEYEARVVTAGQFDGCESATAGDPYLHPVEAEA